MSEEETGADRQAKIDNNMERIQTLGMQAARFAKDPKTNAADQLTEDAKHELLARLAIGAQAFDDV